MSTHTDVDQLQTPAAHFLQHQDWGGGTGPSRGLQRAFFPPLLHFYKRKNNLQHIKNYSSAKTEKPFAGMIASTDRMPQTTLRFTVLTTFNSINT